MESSLSSSKVKEKDENKGLMATRNRSNLLSPLHSHTNTIQRDSTTGFVRSSIRSLSRILMSFLIHLKLQMNFIGCAKKGLKYLVAIFYLLVLLLLPRLFCNLHQDFQFYCFWRMRTELDC